MKVVQWFMQLFASKKQPTVTAEEPEDISLRICISDIGEEFRDTSGYKYHSNIPDSKDTDKT